MTAGGAGGASTSVGPSWSDAAPYAAALAGLPGAGPATLVALLRDWTPKEAWRRVKDGRLVRPGRRRPGKGQLGFDLGAAAPSPGTASVARPLGGGESVVEGAKSDCSWQQAARRIDPPGWWVRHQAGGIGVTWPGHPHYPAALVDDPEPPGVLFWRGSLHCLDRPCVAIVGTRRATPDGRAVAFELGRDLAAVGICVVSGLALGIDGAAHAGALSVGPDAAVRAVGSPAGPVVAGPAAVAASGVDVPYPRRHTLLWERVAEVGVVLSETLPGRAAQAWRFPARNRIIAGLARMVVVVESHAAGGSLITAEAAMARGVEVRVVPGPVHSPASAGSNQLMYDGPGPVRHASDVLDGLGIFVSRRELASDSTAAPTTARRDDGQLDARARRVLDTVQCRPTSLNRVVDRSGVSVMEAARILDSLEAAGLVGRDGGWWVRRPGGGQMA